jgi:GT2 family glycosyltransferase
MAAITVIFFSCRRLHLLDRAIRAFVGLNKYPMGAHIIVNDSGDPKIHDILKQRYEDFTLVLNKENVGLIKSIDIGYSYITTDYFFHCEDDWMVTKDFMGDALTIMESDPKIEEVWLADYNEHPLEPTILKAGNVPYQLACDNYQKGLNGYNDFAWHGFTTACGLKRMSDYRKVAPYADIPWEGTIWHREQAIGERYHDLGYRTACLQDKRATNIGYGQSEYITGDEK